MIDLPQFIKKHQEYKSTKKENKTYVVSNNNKPVFPINYRDLYKLFDDELIKDIGISWLEAHKIYHELGNSPGIYPDTALLFVRLIKMYNIYNVIEFGSGMSTLFLSKICELKNIKFTSYEEDEKYRNINTNLLEAYNIKNSKDIIKSFKNDVPLIINTDLLFLDSHKNSRESLINNKQIYNIPFVIYDDAEDSSPLIKYICNSKDHNFYCYDRVGRLDRQQFISYPSKYNIINFIKENIPCIGTW